MKAQQVRPTVVHGSIDRIEHFQSRYVAPRTIDIWLPEHYSNTNKYAVLYMHDGQMLFDPKQTWNKQAWNIDDVISDLLLNNKLKNVIVVGIWNAGQERHKEYFPQKPFEQLTRREKDTVQSQLRLAGRTKNEFKPVSDHYLTFIVEELKPYIDTHYAVNKDRQHTFIGGSSMGGLISLYAICEYPKIFGGALCMSTHWVGSFTLDNNPIPKSFIKYLKKNLPSPKAHKIYFDCGDQTLDAMYPSIQREVDGLLKTKGYTEKNGLTKYFPGDDHSELSWNKRLNIPLVFLLGK